MDDIVLGERQLSADHSETSAFGFLVLAGGLGLPGGRLAEVAGGVTPASCLLNYGLITVPSLRRVVPQE